MFHLIQSILVSALWVTMGFMPNLFGDHTTTSGSNIAASQPVSYTSTYYLPLVTSHFREVPGDYRDCRLGIGVVHNAISTYDITLLKIGWYVDWQSRLLPARPKGVSFYHTIRVKQNKSEGMYLPSYTITPGLDFTANGLGPMVQANLGNMWLVGNEIDRVNIQDETLPDMYAQIYYDTYKFIKSIDPTAQVAIGSVVQPTPVRLQYLDMVLQAYQTKFGEPMPVDVWNIHIYILREVKDSWGGEIPPGVDASTGMLYTLRDHVDIEVFKSLVIAMRTWMKGRGYQDRPLIITEFGALFPIWFLNGEGITEAEAFQFNQDSINYIATAVDPGLGYPADNYLLVQQGAIYSLDDDSLMTIDDQGSLDYKWGTFLFNSTTPYTPTQMGVYYRDSIAASHTPSVDLFPYRVSSEPSLLISAPTETITPVFKILIANAGNSMPMRGAIPWPVIVRLFDVTEGRNNLIGDALLPPFPGCGSLREARIAWPNLSPGLHVMRIEVDPEQRISDSLPSNNIMTVPVFVGIYTTYLPLIRR